MLGALKNPQPTGFKSIEELMAHKDLTDALKNYYQNQNTINMDDKASQGQVFYPHDPVASTNIDNRTYQDLSFLDPANSDPKVIEPRNGAFWARGDLENSRPSTDPMAIQAGINNIGVPLQKNQARLSPLMTPVPPIPRQRPPTS